MTTHSRVTDFQSQLVALEAPEGDTEHRLPLRQAEGAVGPSRTALTSDRAAAIEVPIATMNGPLLLRTVEEVAADRKHSNGHLREEIRLSLASESQPAESTPKVLTGSWAFTEQDTRQRKTTEQLQVRDLRLQDPHASESRQMARNNLGNEKQRSPRSVRRRPYALPPDKLCQGDRVRREKQDEEQKGAVEQRSRQRAYAVRTDDLPHLRGKPVEQTVSELPHLHAGRLADALGGMYGFSSVGHPRRTDLLPGRLDPLARRSRTTR